MNFDFSDEQHAVREQATRLFMDGRARARRLIETDIAHDAELWRQVVELGFTAASIPETHGGLGLGSLELCVIAEEAGRSLAPVPFSSSVLYATEAIKLGGGAAAEYVLPLLADGSLIGTVALVEGSGSWDCNPRAVVESGKLSGLKQPVVDPSAGIAVVSARAAEDGDGFGWWLVDLRGQGVTRDDLPAIDCIRRHGCLRFEAAPATRLGLPGAGAELASHLLDVAAVFTAFEQIGGAQAQLDRCVDYAKTRKAFGSLIGVNQAVKHRLADMYVKIELARGHALYGAWALSTGAGDLAIAAAGARLSATDAFDFAAEEAIEMHGGIGFTWEDDCHLYYRRARALALLLGNRARWSERLVRALAARPARSNQPEVSDGF